MRLKKSICVRCCNDTVVAEEDGAWAWGDMDDYRWKRGDIWCRALCRRVKTSEVPECCPYAAEHVVSQ